MTVHFPYFNKGQLVCIQDADGRLLGEGRVAVLLPPGQDSCPYGHIVVEEPCLFRRKIRVVFRFVRNHPLIPDGWYRPRVGPYLLDDASLEGPFWERWERTLPYQILPQMAS